MTIEDQTIADQMLLDFENFGESQILNHEQAKVALSLLAGNGDLSIERALTGISDWVIVNRFKKKSIEKLLFQCEFGLNGYH